MNDEPLMEAWKERRRNVEVPSGFSDRIVQVLDEQNLKSQSRWQQVVALWLATTWGRAALCGLAAMVGLLPLSLLFFSLFFSSAAIPSTL